MSLLPALAGFGGGQARVAGRGTGAHQPGAAGADTRRPPSPDTRASAGVGPYHTRAWGRTHCPRGCAGADARGRRRACYRCASQARSMRRVARGRCARAAARTRQARRMPARGVPASCTCRHLPWRQASAARGTQHCPRASGRHPAGQGAVKPGCRPRPASRPALPCPALPTIVRRVRVGTPPPAPSTPGPERERPEQARQQAPLPA